MTTVEKEAIYRRGYNHGYLFAIKDMQHQLKLMNDFLDNELLAWRNGDKSERITGLTFFDETKL